MCLNKGYWRLKDCVLMCDGGEDIVCWVCRDYVVIVGNVIKVKER